MTTPFARSASTDRADHRTRMVVGVGAIVFAAESVIVLALQALPEALHAALLASPWALAAANSACLVLLSSPLIYLLVLRPYILRKNRAELALQDSEQRLKTAQRIASIGSWELDLGSESLTWSDEIYRMFEIDPARFTPLYQSFLDAIHPADREMVNRAYQDSLDNRTPYEIDHRLRLPDGTIKWVRERCETEFDASGRPLVSRGTVQDITYARAAEEALGKSRAIVSGIIEIAEDAIVLADNELRIVLFSRGAEKVFGYSAREALGLSIEALIPERFRAAHRTHVRRFVEGSQSSLRMDGRNELAGMRRDGSEFPAAVSLSKFPQGDGFLYSMIIRDIGPEKTQYEEIMAAKRTAETANQAKSMFLANMSHELRTPLNAIIGFSEVIASQMYGPLENGKYLEYVRDINRSGLHLLKIITDILDISKIEAGKVELNESAVDVAKVAQSSLSLLRGTATARQVAIELDAQPPLPPLYADELKLKQILINLLSNAIKFSAADGIVEVRLWSHPNMGYMIAVADHGIGMRTEDIPSALAPFKQLDSDLDRRYEGTGLGLPLAKALVEMHGGSLDVRSAPGKGTTVTARFGPERILFEPEAQPCRSAG